MLWSMDALVRVRWKLRKVHGAHKRHHPVLGDLGVLVLERQGLAVWGCLFGQLSKNVEQESTIESEGLHPQRLNLQPNILTVGFYSSKKANGNISRLRVRTIP